jgi:hypothetical protein
VPPADRQTTGHAGASARTTPRSPHAHIHHTARPSRRPGRAHSETRTTANAHVRDPLTQSATPSCPRARARARAPRLPAPASHTATAPCRVMHDPHHHHRTRDASRTSAAQPGCANRAPPRAPTNTTTRRRHRRPSAHGHAHAHHRRIGSRTGLSPPAQSQPRPPTPPPATQQHNPPKTAAARRSPCGLQPPSRTHAHVHSEPAPTAHATSDTWTATAGAATGQCVHSRRRPRTRQPHTRQPHATTSAHLPKTKPNQPAHPPT